EIDETVERVQPHPALEVAVRMRATDGGRFDEALSGRSGLAVESMAPWVQHEIARCQRYATLEALVTHTEARAVLQSADALLAALAQDGDLTWSLDLGTCTLLPANEVAERAFSVEHHFLVVVESVERAPGVGHLVRSRGLTQFGRPDVAMRAPRA